jgi:CheY-like chemotaxis protein
MALQLVHIESDSGLAEEVRRAFGPAGFQIVTVPAGEQAVDRCRAHPPDLILLAAELPDMSGFSVCNRLKRALPSVPLILYTSEATASAIEAHRATRTRADEYVRKPFDMADLVGRSAQLLQGGAPAAAPSPPRAGPAGAGPPVLPRAAPPRQPPVPPPLSPAPPGPAAPPPGAAAKAQPVARAKRAATPLPDVFDPFADAPRDPPPPKGSPEEKLEFFRERLRARDAFLAKVKDVFAAARAEAARLQGEIEALRGQSVAEGTARAAMERKAAEQEAAGAARDARIAELERKVVEVESTRQSLSDVLSETMQAQEAGEQQWSLRVAGAEEERARSEALRREELARAEETLATRTAGFEAERAEMSGRLAALQTEHEELQAESKRLSSELDRENAAHEELRLKADRELDAARGELDETRARAEQLAGELAEARGRGEALEAEAARRREAEAALQAELKAARAEAGAYGEKAAAVEQSYLAQRAELEAARRHAAELAASLEEGRTSTEGVRGEVARLQAELGAATRKLTHAVAERDQMAQRAEAESRGREEAMAAVARLEGETARLAELESRASDAARLKRELAQAQELLQQRTQQVQSASRSAHDATAERERVRERLELDNERLQGEVAKRDSEVSALKRRLAELEQDRAGREAESRKAVSESEAQRRGRVEETVEAEKRHLAEASRLKGALVDMERRLEAVGRAESQAKRKLQELEKKGAGAAPEELAQLQQKVGTLEADLQDLRGENDFLNSEVARYQQKNKDLQTMLDGMKEA